MEETIQTKKAYLNDFQIFINEYGHLYPKEVLEYILETFDSDDYLEAPSDVMSQIYAQIGARSDNKNRYKGFFELLKARYDIGKNVLEIAGGHYPIMAKYIDDEQVKLGKGSITVYDPNLIINRLGNIKLVKEKVLDSTNVATYDLIIGISPCHATELVISKANRAKKEFFVALCGCTHFDNRFGFYDQPTREEWQEYIYELAKKTIDKDYELMVEYLDDSYEYPLPIISSRKKNKVLTYNNINKNPLNN